jgi:hypothetical protein
MEATQVNCTGTPPKEKPTQADATGPPLDKQAPSEDSEDSKVYSLCLITSSHCYPLRIAW